MVEDTEAQRSQRQLRAAVPDPATVAAILVLDIHQSRRISPVQPTALSDVTEALRDRAREMPQRLGKLQDHGDGLLQCFSDVVAAAVCAVSLHHLLNDPVLHQGKLSIRARIALHLGHIILKRDGGTGGDALRIASRLEPIVEPGQTWTSAAFADVLRQLMPNVGLATRYLGLKMLAEGDGSLECYELIDTTLQVSGDAHTAALIYQPQDEPLANCQRLLGSRYDADQNAAIQALVSIRTWSAVKLLVDFAGAKESEPTLRRRCLIALQQIAEPDLVPHLQRIIDEEEVLSLKRLAIEVLGACACADAIERLSQLASPETATPAIREAALLALRHLPDASIGKVLIKALQDENPDLVSAACVAASTRRLTTLVADALIDLVRDNKTSDAIREIALEAFVAKGSDHRHLQDLIELAKDVNKSPQLRMLALENLADVSSEPALNALQEIAAEQSDIMRRAALAFVLAVQLKPTPTRLRTKSQQSASRIKEVLLSRVEGNPLNDRYLSDIA
jgi:class 3 adenylate cyclase/HEAT repeat protein